MLNMNFAPLFVPLFALISINFCDGIIGLGTLQSVAVRGKLICNGKPSVGTKVKLYDKDRFGIDDKMAEGLTNGNGEFMLQGSQKEITTIDPKVNIYHNCNDEKIPCLLKFSIEIPDNYITKGSMANKVFDVGTLNLDGKFSGQKRDCIN